MDQGYGLKRLIGDFGDHSRGEFPSLRVHEREEFGGAAPATAASRRRVTSVS